MNRMFWIVPLALTVALGSVSLPARLAASDGGSSNEVRTLISLSGAAIGGVVPKGKAEYRRSSTYRAFKVQVEQVRLPDKTTLAIAVNGSSVGYISLLLGRGELQRSTKDRQSVPVIKPGDIVTATTATTTLVLQGRF